MHTQKNILFYEKQYFREGSGLPVVVAASVFSIVLVAVLYFIGEVPASEFVILLPLMLFIFGLIFYLFFITRLETVVTYEGVTIRWIPFMKKGTFISRDMIERAEVRKAPLLSYGFKLHPGYGRVHNAGGGEGIQLYLKSGKKIYVSTREIFLFRKALEKLTRNA